MQPAKIHIHTVVYMQIHAKSNLVLVSIQCKKHNHTIAMANARTGGAVAHTTVGD